MAVFVQLYMLGSRVKFFVIDLHVTECSILTCNTVFPFYVQHCVAFLRVTVFGTFTCIIVQHFYVYPFVLVSRVTECGSFTCNRV